MIFDLLIIKIKGMGHVNLTVKLQMINALSQ